eukprot:115859_1
MAISYSQTLLQTTTTNNMFEPIKDWKNENENIASNKQLSFIHIPKNAGTTVENLGFKNGYHWALRYRPPQNIHINTGPFGLCQHSQNIVNLSNQCCCSHWHTPPSYMILNYNLSYYNLSNHNLFSIVRNPIHRFISEYWWELQVAFKLFAKKGFIPYLNSVGMGYLNNSSQILKHACSQELFNTWLRWKRMITNDNECISDCHLLPQHRYTHFNNGTLLIQYVLKFESLPNDFNFLMKIHNINSTFIREKRGTKCMNVQANMIENDLKLWIQNKYANDFDLFGYNISDFDILYP